MIERPETNPKDRGDLPDANRNRRDRESDRIFDDLTLGESPRFADVIQGVEPSPDILTTWALRLIDRMPERPRPDLKAKYEAIQESIQRLEVHPDQDNSPLITATFMLARSLDSDRREQEVDPGSKSLEERIRQKTSLLEILEKKVSRPHTHPETLRAFSLETELLLQSSPPPERIVGKAQLEAAFCILQGGESIEALHVMVRIIRYKDLLLVDNKNFGVVSKIEELLDAKEFPVLSSSEVSRETRAAINNFLAETFDVIDEFSATSPEQLETDDKSTFAVKRFLLRGLRSGGPQSHLSDALIGILGTSQGIEKYGEQVLDLLFELENTAEDTGPWAGTTSSGLERLYESGQGSTKLTTLLIQLAPEKPHIHEFLLRRFEKELQNAESGSLLPMQIPSALALAIYQEARGNHDIDSPSPLQRLVGRLQFAPAAGEKLSALGSALQKCLESGDPAMLYTKPFLLGLRDSASREFDKARQGGKLGKWHMPVELHDLIEVATKKGGAELQRELLSVISEFPPITACGNYQNTYAAIKKLTLKHQDEALAEYLLRENPISWIDEVNKVDVALRRRGITSFTQLTQDAQQGILSLAAHFPETVTTTIVEALANDPRWKRKNPRHEIYFDQADNRKNHITPLAQLARAFGSSMVLQYISENLGNHEQKLVQYHLLRELRASGVFSLFEYERSLRPLRIPLSHRITHFMRDLWGDITGSRDSSL